MIEAAKLVARLNALPAMPAAVMRLSELVYDEAATASDFERVIRPDPALTANVLRAANSVFYRGVREVASVRDAVARMGLRRVFEVAVSGAFRRTLPAVILGYDLPVSEFWRHCVAVAQVCERLAREHRLMVPNIAFTAGLLHDVGKLVIGMCLADVVSGSWTLADLASPEAEQKAFGFDHPDVGEEIALRWCLPVAVKDAACWHHAPSCAPEGAETTAATLVHAVDAAYYRFGLGSSGSRSERLIEPGILERFGLSLEQLKRVVEESREVIDRMTEVTTAASA